MSNRGGRVKSFRCADAGVMCNAEVTGATEDEVVAKAVEHAKKVHGVDISVSTTLADYARSVVRDRSGGAS
jgi:predicted small metal-binding protein